MKKHTASVLGLILLFALQGFAQEHYTEGPDLAGDSHSRQANSDGCLPHKSASQQQRQFTTK